MTDDEADSLVNKLCEKFSAECDEAIDRVLKRELLFGPCSFNEAWDLFSVESALKEAESALVARDAMRAPEPVKAEPKQKSLVDLAEDIAAGVEVSEFAVMDAYHRENARLTQAAVHEFREECAATMLKVLSGCKCEWAVLDGERIRDSALCGYCHAEAAKMYKFPVLTGIENGQSGPCCPKCFQCHWDGERHFCHPTTIAALHSIKKKACECRVMRAIDVIRSGLDLATLTSMGWEQLADAPGYRHRCPEHKVTSKRVGSVDICIKHQFRGTAEQPGCPECAASDEEGFGAFFTHLKENAGTQVRVFDGGEKLLEQPVTSTWISTRGLDMPAETAPKPSHFTITISNLDAATEPTYATRYGKWEPEESSTPQKRSDEPVPAWLSAEASWVPTAKACGCTTIHGITFSCIACAKGGL